GISVGIAFQRKIGAGLFGGEGFILQKLEGDGLAFVHAGGTVVERTLGVGETMRLDTGCLVAFEQQVSYDIQMVKGIKSAIFGGEGLFFAALTGPGKVWIQSLPFSRLADRIFKAAPQTGGTRKGEGSVLGGAFDLLGGD
ncbi:MAG: AIM24 family protein, partial [bacterium]|nr:AIM24 family protein [bacterium]